VERAGEIGGKMKDAGIKGARTRALLFLEKGAIFCCFWCPCESRVPYLQATHLWVIVTLRDLKKNIYI
jgi:hypothetical protein